MIQGNVGGLPRRRMGRAMVLAAVRKRDRGEDVVMDAAAAKLALEMAVADRAVQIFGGSTGRRFWRRALLSRRAHLPPLRRHQ